jgi:hypothetical protein
MKDGAGSRRAWGGVPPRNPAFTGRDGLLGEIRNGLASGSRVAVHALHGLGGVGKTQLAAEYAHRFAAEYDVAWWVSSEQAELIGPQFAALAEELGCAAAGSVLEVMRSAVLADLRQRPRWLLIFDNAESPEAIAPWLPAGTGHVLITSRSGRWEDIAVPVRVDVLARPESQALLQALLPGIPAATASRLAAALGDLPLALAQAAGYIAETGLPADKYLELLSSQAGPLMDAGQPASYPTSLAAVIQLSFSQLRDEDQAAADMAAACAFLGPEPIPLSLFTASPGLLPPALGQAAADPAQWRPVLARLGRQALARVEGNAIQVHRLTQAIIRSLLPEQDADAARAAAEAVITAGHPGDPHGADSWPGWARLLPHLTALDPARTSNPALRTMACAAARYLAFSGDAPGSHDLARPLFEGWRGRDGADDRHTLEAAFTLSVALRELGQFRAAHELSTDTVARRRRVLGEDHPDTLISVNNLANDLFMLDDFQAARKLREDNLARRRRVLGEDHPDTLRTAANLANDLAMLGELQPAIKIGRDVLARRGRVLGQDHPETLASLNNLAAALGASGDHKAARKLHEKALPQRRRILGADHPDALQSAVALATELSTLGYHRAALDLNQDTLARRRRLLGYDHLDTLATATRLATSHYHARNFRAARDLGTDTLARKRRVLGEDHPETLAAGYALASSLYMTSDYQAAHDLFADTLARQRQVLGDSHSHTLLTAQGLRRARDKLR